MSSSNKTNTADPAVSEPINAHILGFDQDWQYPAITEKHAYEMMRQLLESKTGDATSAYVGFPWATLIDLKHHAGHQTTRIGALEGALADLQPQLGRFERVFTVSQHIHMSDYLADFKAAGVTDIFWTHATRQSDHGPDDGSQGLRIHPFPLYPVQQVPVGFDDLDAPREVLFSFVGARAEHYYLTDIRNQILDLLGNHPRGRIIDRDAWHYEKIVYDKQVHGHASAGSELINQATSAEFRSIMAQSLFTLCPSGTGPNSIRLWEAALNNSIPVILSDNYRFPGDAGLWQLATVHCDETGDALRDLPERLARIAADPEVLRRKRLALYLLVAKYGPACFVHDIVRAMQARQ